MDVTWSITEDKSTTTVHRRRADERQRIGAHAPVRIVHIARGHLHDDDVVPHPPVDGVVPRAANELVVARQPGEGVGAAGAGEDIVKRIADAGDRTPRQLQILHIGGEGVVEGGHRGVGARVQRFAHHVGQGVHNKPVVPGAPDQRIVAAPAIQGVVARAPVQDVVAAGAGQHVVAGVAGEGEPATELERVHVERGRAGREPRRIGDHHALYPRDARR